jgi:hypothetical protein
MEKRNMTGIKITNANIAENFMGMFAGLWHFAKK